MFNQVDYVMITVSDMERSIAFYRDKLGLPLKYQTKEWTEFATGKTTLALHGGGKIQSQPGQSGEMLAGTCSIGFKVEDIDKAYNDLNAKGIIFVMTPKEREGEGIKLAVCLDPDGLQVSLSESVRRQEKEVTA